MATISLLGTNLAVILVLVTALWLASRYLDDVSIVDVFWGIGFVVLAWNSWLTRGSTTESLPILPLVITAWGLRLAAYLWLRQRGRPEDFRYAAMRQRYGAKFPLVSLFLVFWLQALLMWIVAIPVQVSPMTSTGWDLFDCLGLLLAACGLLIESIADYQMWRFKSLPANRGRILNRGLWRYSRHPNYFGDSLMWWGIYIITATDHTWWWTWIGPALMTFLLLRVSGVRLLDSALEDRLPEYAEYIHTTSSFFPMRKRSKRRAHGYPAHQTSCLHRANKMSRFELPNRLV